VTEKLHKVLARAGFGSRRHIEQWIQDGRVTVNGEVARIGARVGPEDRLQVDGRPVEATRPVAARVLMYNKPLGEVVTRSDPEGRPTVFSALPPLRTGRWITVGRLDINTTGLILFTNDGELANLLMHPAANLDREYIARVYGDVDEEKIRRLESGVPVGGRPASFKSIVPLGKASSANRSYRVVLTEGRNREVRHLWEAVGCTVSRLKRVRFGPVALPRDLNPGRWRELTGGELKALTGGGRA
jgi:23S rRNA pseudouridine2605 synthase